MSYSIRFLLLSLLLIFIFSFSASSFLYAQCEGKYQKTITIDNTMVSGTDVLENFPVLIQHADPDLIHDIDCPKVKHPEGYDICFTDAAGIQLDHEIEHYDPVTGEIVMWVRIPELDPSLDTELNLVYGNPFVSTSPSTTSTWNEDYVSVWHLNEEGNGTVDEYVDYSGNAHHGAGGGGVPTQNNGKIHNAQLFTGSQEIIFPYDTDFDLPTDFTVSAWAWLDQTTTGTGNINTIINKQVTWTNRNFWLVHWDNEWRVRTSSPQVTLESTENSTTQEWVYLTLTANGNNLTLYVNGVENDSQGFTSTDTQTEPIIIGRENNENRFFNGLIDEVRISNIDRSADWVATEFNNQNNPLNFYSIGVEELTNTLYSQTVQYPGSGNTLDFQDNREVIAPTGTDLCPSSDWNDLTVETWVYWRGQSGGASGIMEGRSSAIHFEITNNADPGRIRVRVNGNNALIVDGVVPKNEWVHLAFVYDDTPGSEVIIGYKNGVEFGRRNGNGGGGNNFNNWLRFGVSCCTGGTGRAFNGHIDEIRVWYKTKTEEEIRQDMCRKLTGNEDDLLLYYRLDSIDFDNNLVYDLANGNHGTLSNIDQSHHVVSGAALGEESNYIYGSNSLTHSHSSTDELEVELTAGTSDGIQLYSEGMFPNTFTGTQGTGGNNQYYGVFLPNASSDAEYEATYHYSQNPAYLNSDQNLFDDSELQLFVRENNADMTWVNSGAPVNVAQQNITTTATNTEFYLGLDGGEALPIELISFNAQPKNDAVHLTWSTATEINNDYFTIERSRDAINFEPIEEIPGAGNSMTTINYEAYDRNPFSGTSYYRLKQTDFDGTYSYSDIRTVRVYESFKARIYPNPTSQNETFIIEVDTDDVYTIQVTDLSGRTVLTRTNLRDQRIELDARFKAGVYIVSILQGNQKNNIKLVVR